MVTLNIDQEKLTGVKKPAGIYLIAVAGLVALYFILTPFFSESFDVMIVWHALDVLMFLGFGIALGVNYLHKRDNADKETGSNITRQYLEANVLFYITAGLTIMFLYNWFSLLSHGNNYLYGNFPAWNLWNIVDIAVPLTFGVTGCRLLREGIQSGA
jgi:hypothetical protein